LQRAPRPPYTRRMNLPTVMLKENFIDIYRVDAGATVREMIARYYNGEIEPITVPHPAEDSEVGRQKRIPVQSK